MGRRLQRARSPPAPLMPEPVGTQPSHSASTEGIPVGAGGASGSRPSHSGSSVSTYHPSPLGPHPHPSSPSSPIGTLRYNPPTAPRVVSSEAYALTGGLPGSLPGGHRGSMILYEFVPDNRVELVPPPHGQTHRGSMMSTGTRGSKVYSISEDNKYPGASLNGPPRGILAYAYDPEMDLAGGPVDDDDELHDSSVRNGRESTFGWRGVANIGVLVLIIGALLTLFVGYPVITFYRHSWKV